MDRLPGKKRTFFKPWERLPIVYSSDFIAIALVEECGTEVCFECLSDSVTPLLSLCPFPSEALSALCVLPRPQGADLLPGWDDQLLPSLLENFFHDFTTLPVRKKPSPRVMHTAFCQSFSPRFYCSFGSGSSAVHVVRVRLPSVTLGSFYFTPQPLLPPLFTLPLPQGGSPYPSG